MKGEAGGGTGREGASRASGALWALLSVFGAGRPPWRSCSRCTPSSTCSCTAPTPSAASNWTTGSWQVGPSGVWGPRVSPASPSRLSCPSSAQSVPPAPLTPPCHPSPSAARPLACAPALALFSGPSCFLARPEAARIQLMHTGPLSTGLLSQRMFVMLPCGGVGVSVPRGLEQALPWALRSLPCHSPRPSPCLLVLGVLPDSAGQGLSHNALLLARSSLWIVCLQPTRVS